MNGTIINLTVCAGSLSKIIKMMTGRLKASAHSLTESFMEGRTSGNIKVEREYHSHMLKKARSMEWGDCIIKTVAQRMSHPLLKNKMFPDGYII